MPRTETIYVYLLNEGTDAWVPVSAERVRDNVFRIIDCGGEDDAAQFKKGELVRCRRQRLSDDESLVAYEATN
ncbi:MAG: hypothetical protein ABSA49_10960 [Rhizomicrobium sp.]|jgi:hypothetical protein